jgi:hypothetical protein
MADHFYGVNVGGGLSPGNVTVGTSTTGLNIELRTHDGAALTRMQVLLALEQLEAYFSENNAPTP